MGVTHAAGRVPRLLTARPACYAIHIAHLGRPCVQTLLNDCKDLDPTIRGLAVRSMAGLRVPELMDSVVRCWCWWTYWHVCWQRARGLLRWAVGVCRG